MNILLVSSYLPYPLHSGGHVRLYNIIKHLSKKHSITLVCEKRPYQTQNDIDMVKALCKEIITVDRKPQWSLKNLLRTASSSYPFLMVGHWSSDMTSAIEKVLSIGNIDIIHVETFYVMHNLPETSIPVVLAEQNIEYEVYERYATTAPIFLQPFLAADVSKMKYWESTYWGRADRLIAVSPDEASKMQRTDVVVIPNGVDGVNFSFQENKKKERILFLGDFKWIENREAGRIILKNIWPKIKKRLPSVTLWIVGKNIPGSIKKLGDKSVVFDEKAPDDTREIYKKSYVLLSPRLVGGGTSFKILEAMATGTPVVTTPLGVSGLMVEEGKDIIVGANHQAITDEVIKLFEDHGHYKKIAKSARGKVVDLYDWKNIIAKLEELYTKVKNEKK